MSQINTNAILDASGGTTTTVNGFTPTASNMAGRNRIINGDMRIDQRNAGSALTLTNATKFPVDRFAAFKDTAGATCTAQQSSTVPNGEFTKSLLWTTTTGATAGVGDDCCIRQFIEGFNFADLGFGTAAARSFTLSFWARSSVTGTYGVSLANSAPNRCYIASYSIDVANTWEFKTITVAGDTTGTWVPDAGIGLRIFWDMGSGTSRSLAASSAWGSSYGTGLTGGVKIAANTGATFYITGVQLEVGSVATPFEHRQYGQELALCQRYFYKHLAEEWGFQTVALGNTYTRTRFDFKASMRATPTIAGISYNTAGSVGSQFVTVDSCNLYANPSLGGSGAFAPNWTASAEL